MTDPTPQPTPANPTPDNAPQHDPGATWANIKIVRSKPGTEAVIGSSLPPPPPETSHRNLGDEGAGMRTSRLQVRQMSARPAEKMVARPGDNAPTPMIPVTPAPSSKLSIATPPPQSAPPAADPPPPEQTSPPPLRPRSGLGGLSFKKVEVEMPENLATPPAPKREISQAATMELFRHIAVVLMVLSSLTLLTLWPVFDEWRKSGRLELLHALTALGIVIFMGLLVIPKKKVLASLGILFIVVLAGVAGVLTIHPALIADVFPEKMVPNQAWAAGGLAMMLGALVLQLASGTGGVVSSGLFFVIGIILPLLPVGDYITKDLGITFVEEKKTMAPLPGTTTTTATTAGTTATQPPNVVNNGGDISTISTPEYAVDLPIGWSNLPPPPSTKAGYLYRIGLTKEPEAFSVLVVTEHAESEDIVTLATRRLDMLRASNPGSQGYVMLISGNPDRRRIYLSAGQEIQEVLIVLKRKTLFVLNCQAPRSLWQVHKPELDTIFKTFTPR